jgi:hypothetical protein
MFAVREVVECRASREHDPALVARLAAPHAAHHRIAPGNRGGVVFRIPFRFHVPLPKTISGIEREKDGDDSKCSK